MLEPKSVAVIGASRDEEKIGHIILQNYIDAGYSGKLYPVNKSGEDIAGLKTYKSILNIKSQIDLAVIAIPAQFVPEALEECGKMKVKSAVVVSGGFAEIGELELQKSIIDISKKYNIAMLGPNCLGVMNPKSRIDTLFLPTYKLSKPKAGGVSFIAQSGAVGSVILDLIAKEGFGLAKFFSYGNAALIDETDILDFLIKDEDTKVIVMYIEGITRGREFIELAREATKKKPCIVIKGGVTPQGAQAAHSHTAAIAGDAQTYEAVFRQFGFIVANDLSELLYYAKAFVSEPVTEGDRAMIITNGGGMGVLTTDEVYENGLKMAEFSKDVALELRKKLPNIIAIRNPLDLVGDADDVRYNIALEAAAKDPNIDIIIAIVLFQTPGADSRVASTLIHYKKSISKPLLVISMGSDYTQVHKTMMESSGLPVYESPASAAASLAQLLKYAKYLKRQN
jgi:acetyl coenzyme A synthetase (ADP forming)-like protein